VSYTSAEGRTELLEQLADATDKLALALACLGAAYEQLDERTADQLEEQLFRPLQLAYGRAQRTYKEFAERHGLPPRVFEVPSAGLESQRPNELIERAADATRDADEAIASLQDSMLPVEVGDQELRAGLSEVRAIVDHIPHRAHELVRVVGR
jgi:hypothetical protein